MADQKYFRFERGSRSGETTILRNEIHPVGAGLFVGLELVTDREKRSPATETAALVVKRLKEEDKICVSTDGPWENILKFKPPMCFSIEDAEVVVQCIDRILTDIEASGIKLEKEDI